MDAREIISFEKQYKEYIEKYLKNADENIDPLSLGEFVLSKQLKELKECISILRQEV